MEGKIWRYQNGAAKMPSQIGLNYGRRNQKFWAKVLKITRNVIYDEQIHANLESHSIRGQSLPSIFRVPPLRWKRFWRRKQNNLLWRYNALLKFDKLFTKVLFADSRGYIPRFNVETSQQKEPYDHRSIFRVDFENKTLAVCHDTFHLINANHATSWWKVWR